MHQEERAGTRQRRQAAQNNDMFEMNDNDSGVRAPMQFQQEQLIGDNANLVANVGLYEAMAQAARQYHAPQLQFESHVRNNGDEEMKNEDEPVN